MVTNFLEEITAFIFRDDHLKMEAVYSPVMLVTIHEMLWYNIPEVLSV
jgi:hypothetical protein